MPPFYASKLVARWNRRPRRAAIEAPRIDGLEWTDLLFNDFSDQVEDFRVAIHRVAQIPDVGSDNRHVERWPRLCGMGAGKDLFCESANTLGAAIRPAPRPIAF
jgi:hypothetical protein